MYKDPPVLCSLIMCLLFKVNRLNKDTILHKHALIYTHDI